MNSNMAAFQIIPAIDIIGGACVRLTQGDYNQKKSYNSNPLEVAKAFEGVGIKRLHLVDLDGAKAKQVVNLKVLEEIASKTSLHVDFGGGIQSEEDIKKVLNAGAKQVTGGSIAVRNPELFESWINEYGPQTMILGADTKDGFVAISGWQENSTQTVDELIARFVPSGIKYVISTDVAKDGLLQGPSFELYSEIQKKFPDLHVIASGGVRHLDDVLTLKEQGVYGVIIGKAFYEGFITLGDFERVMSQQN